jgi:imidazolonepropionase
MAPSLLITRIGELVTNAPDGSGSAASALPAATVAATGSARTEGATAGGTTGPGRFSAISDAALVIEDDWIAWTGSASQAPAADDFLDAGGRAVLPGFVDSHAHLVFAGDRSAEFAARMAGRPYQAGGIRVTVAATRAATEAELRAGLRRLAAEMLRQGTTTFECKSGYGLTVNDEARSVALAAEVTPEVTYLGAHVVPPEFAADPAAYLDLVCGPMLDACAPHCRWADVFCERGAFGEAEARAVLTAGLARGLLPRIHASQLGPGPGIRLAVELGAASADHCTFLTDADVAALASSDTVATLLPGAEFSTRQPYPDARRLLDAGATVALATDCNPGTSYTTSMPFCVALAVRDMRMTTEEAVWSATAGGARALRRTDVGYLAPGARADLIILDAPSHAHLAYRPGVPLVHSIYKSGYRQPSLPQWRGPNPPTGVCGGKRRVFGAASGPADIRKFTIRAFSVGEMIPKILLRA